MPSTGRRRKNPRRSGRGGGSVVDKMLVASSRSTGKESTNFPAADLQRSAPSFMLTQSPPKNIRGQIHWVQGIFIRVNGLSASANTEINFSFTLNDVASLAGIQSYYDQYCIYSVVMTIQCNDVGVSASTETGRGYTAIDYDNTTNLGSENAIGAYGTCVAFIPGRSVQQRLIKPCVAPTVYNTGAAFTGFGVGRCWLDCASPNIPHYGFRSYYAGNAVSGLNIDYIGTYTIGLRNNN